MTLDGFLTFLTLIVGAYSIAEPTIRLRIRLNGALLLVTCITGFALVCYIEYFALAGPPCFTWAGLVCPLVTVQESQTPTVGQLAFAVVVAWVLLCIAALSSRRISIWSVPTLRKLISELAVRRKFAELIDVAAPHVPFLSAIVKAKHERERRRFRATDDDPDTNVRTVRPAGRIEVGVARRLGALSGAERAAEQALRELLHDDELTGFIARYRPSFGVLLLDTPGLGVYEFSDAYMETLIAVPGSTLYSEVKDNQNLTDRRGYSFPEENLLLHYLFGDARNAERLAVWKPVGEWLIAKLKRPQNDVYVDTLNLSAEGFADKEAWRDPTFVVVRFFDLMVSAAVRQGVTWHMWLYYFPHFMGRLVAIYDETAPEVDPTDEFPTRAAYLIYEMFSAMRSWVQAVEHIEPSSPHATLESEDPTHENGNIPKSAILAIGMCLRELVLAPRIGHRFKQYMVEVVVHGLDALPVKGPLSPFRRAYIRSIVAGGSEWTSDAEYRGELLELYVGLDHILLDRTRDLTNALRKP